MKLVNKMLLNLSLTSDNVQIDLHFYKNISCSDIVYGFAEVNDNGLKLPTKLDLIPHSYYGNFKLITSLQLISTSPRVLLGMKMASNAHFLDLKRPELAQNVTRRMVFFTKRYGFSGICIFISSLFFKFFKVLKFDSDVLLTPGFEQFVELLGDEIKKEKKRSGMRKLRLILSISSNWVKYVYRRMPKFDAYFDAFYLWADEISSTSEFPIPSVAVPVDPLHNSELVPLKDSLARNAGS
uniref:Uncharacterized protein n=1 Tax=Meloidogyne enterolobii TaxID=390850 RepID=A0A6V7VSE8_MELEN|nr:unnamed protein product [Meloidogyne enterolobii]